MSRSSSARKHLRLICQLSMLAMLSTFNTAAYGEVSAGVISTVAGTGTRGYNGDSIPASAAQLNEPAATALDGAGNLYICDLQAHRIRRIDAISGIITTVAGNGTAGFSGDGGLATSAHLSYPHGIAINSAGDLFIADAGNHRVRKVAAGSGIITTVAGGAVSGFAGDGGPAVAASLSGPLALAFDPSGNLYIADNGNSRIRKVAIATGFISTIAGNGNAPYNGDGIAATSAQLNAYCVAVDSTGDIYVADSGNHRIRKIDSQSGLISTVAGMGVNDYSGEGGLATAAALGSPLGLAIDGSDNVYIASTNRIRKLIKATGTLVTVAGSGSFAFDGDGGLATAASLHFPRNLAVSASGVLYIADSNNARVRKVAQPTATLQMTTLAGTGTPGFNGDGSVTTATLYNPSAAALDASGNVYIADSSNYRVRRVSPAGTVTTYAGTGVAGFAGDGGLATAARIGMVIDLKMDSSGNLYLLESTRIRKITVNGIITTIAGTGTPGYGGDGGVATAAQFFGPYAIALDASDNLYVADSQNHRIRKITATSGVITTIAGTGSPGFSGDGSIAAASQISYPMGLAVDGVGNVYIGDSGNGRIRKISGTTGVITTVAGDGSTYGGYRGENVAATSAAFGAIAGVAVDGAANIYVVDLARIRKIAVGTGVITTVAGSDTLGFGGDGGVATAGQLSALRQVAVDSAGASMYIADPGNHRVRRIAAPAAPSSLRLQRYGPNGVILTWTAPAGATGFVVKRSQSSGAETPLATVGTASAYITGSLGSRYYFTVTALYGGIESGTSNEVAVSLTANGARGDYDGDHLSDLMLYRSTSGNWFGRLSANSYQIGAGNWSFGWGSPGDVPMTGDFDGDGKVDPTVFRPSSGQWFILYSTRNWNPAQYGYLEWGAANDVPFAADFDGDGYCDIGVFRPSEGRWYLRLSSRGWVPGAGAWTFGWGAPGDVPVTGDMDADGRADIGVFRPSTGQWFFLYSSLNYDPDNFGYFSWGATGDMNLTADFDGDARGDIGVYRPSTGQWFLLLSSTGYNPAQYGYFAWGTTGDMPIMGDFDGDGRNDVTVYRPTTGSWFIRYSGRSYDPGHAGVFGWGAPGDTALPIN